MLNFYLLGTPRIVQDQLRLSELPAAKSQALLFYLACRGRIQSRLALSGLLWPNKTDQEARMNLRQAVYQVRQSFPTLLETTRESVSLQADIEVDTVLFEQEVKAGLAGAYQQLIAAAERYQGDFLDGFYLEDAPDFEEWLLLERERLRGLAIQVFHQLAMHHASQDEIGSSVLYMSRLLAMEPLREESHQQMMRLLATDGQTGAALAQYERCRELLAQSLHVEPSDETTALYHAIKNGEISRKRPQTMAPIRTSHPIIPHNLPLPTTPFIGRTRELETLNDACHKQAARLITIVGTGGMGKTRLGLAFAELCRDHHAGNYPEGVFFVSLANFTPNPELPLANQISLEIARTLRVSLDNTNSFKHLLLDFLVPRRLLLVLDNFEHLLSGHLLIAEMLQAAPHLKIIVTSRERLNLYEERVLTLRGLALPSDQSEGAETNLSEAAELFINAARRRQSQFKPESHGWTALATLCHLLDGSPLALELAAAWVDTLSVDDILRELQHDLSLLSTELNNVAERHRSLSQVFDYAWQRLTPEEQRVLAALTIFKGGFTRVAAAAVIGHSLSPRLLASLVHKSLIAQDARQERYTIHELVHRFVVEKTGRHTTQALDVPQRHSDYYCQLLQQYEKDLWGPRQEQVLSEMEADIENIRMAWQWAVARRNTNNLAAALHSLFHLYDIRSRFLEGEQLFREAALRFSWDNTDGAERVVLARLQARQGWFTFHLGQHSESLRLLQDALAYLREQGDNNEIAFCLNYLGAVMRHQNRYEKAETHLQEALHIAQTSRDRYATSISYNTLGQTAFAQGNLEQARHYCEEGLRLKRQIGDTRGMIYSLTYLGLVAQAQDDQTAAQQLFNESLLISTGIGDRRGMAIAWQNLGDVALKLKDDGAAATAFEQALDLFRAIGDRLGRGRCLLRQGELFIARKDERVAAQCLREGLEIGLAIHSEPVLLEGVLRIANLWLYTGQAQRARLAFDFVQQLPQITMLRPRYWEQLQQKVKELSPALTTPPLTLNELDLETFVREWVLAV